MSKGTFIKLNRSLAEHWIWLDEPFSKGQAWVDLLMRARWTDGKQMHRGKVYSRKRGEVCCSLTFLAERWGWSRNKVKRFMKLLEEQGMITLNGTTRDTTITIVNYSKFQDKIPTDGATDETIDGQQTDSRRTADGHLTDHKKRKERIEKKEKKEKNYIYSRAAQEIVAHLNERLNTQYKPTTGKTQSLIHARMEEGFTVEDFKTVIDKKCVEWMNTDMQKYLRPETLFGTKFESYLNTPVIRPQEENLWERIARGDFDD